MQPLKIYAEWDIDATHWVATSNDIAGLALEASTIDDLVEQLNALLPELMLRNKQNIADKELSFMLIRNWPVIQYFSNSY